MDENKLLDDSNLERLDFIKSIDVYSIVNKEFDEKRKRNKTKSIIFISITTLIILSISVLLGMFISQNIRERDNYSIIGLILGYYFISTWVAMLIVIPLIRKRKSILE